MENGDRLMVYNGIKRASKGSNKAWVVKHKRVVTVFFDRDYNGDFRASLQEAENHLTTVYSPGKKFGKPKYELVKVKRPYSKDPTDLIPRVRLTRFIGGYKFFDLDPNMMGADGSLKAFIQAEDFHYEEGIKLGYIKAKPNTANLMQLQRLEERYARSQG